MMKKSTEEAKSAAEKILAKAAQDSEQKFKEMKAEARVAAEKEATALIAEAHRQAKSLREEQLNGIRAEAASLAQKLQNELIANIEGIKKQVMSIGIKAEPVVSNNNAAPHTAPVDNKDKKSPVLSDGEKGILLDHIPWLEIEIMPPMEIEKIMDLISQLENLPEVKTTDLLPETPNPLIRVFLNKPMPLADMLRTFPQIALVKELSDTTDNQSGDKRQRIQVTLGKNPGKNSGSKKDATVLMVLTKIFINFLFSQLKYHMPISFS
jgi:hypothetical protein